MDKEIEWIKKWAERWMVLKWVNIYDIIIVEWVDHNDIQKDKPYWWTNR